jgi:hypothetical protein
MKRTLLLAGLVVQLLYAPVASAQEARTQWTPIEKSLTALLNEGWRIISHSGGPVVATVTSTDAVIYKTISTTYSLSFVLMRESKVAICLVDGPEPNNASSRCRALN